MEEEPKQIKSSEELLSTEIEEHIESQQERGEKLSSQSIENNAQKIEELKQEINSIQEEKELSPEIQEELIKERQEKIQKYQQKHLPEYLKEMKGKPSFMSPIWKGILSIKEHLGLQKIEGRENIPTEGPFLVISNHTGGESGTLWGVFDKLPLRIASGDELNWKRAPFMPWLLKKMGMLSVKESLANLSAEEKQELLGRVPGKTNQEGYKRVIEGEKEGSVTMNRDFIRITVASLLAGEVVSVFPEGLFLYQDGRQLRQAYPGVELIVKEYERVSGQKLPILPMGINPKETKIGQPFEFSVESENEDSITDIDGAMRQIAQLLPEEERGFYGEKTNI